MLNVSWFCVCEQFCLYTIAVFDTFVICQVRKESVETLSTNRRARCSLWLMLCTPWLTPYTACTWTCVPAPWVSARRWTLWKDGCSSNTFALSTSMVSFWLSVCVFSPFSCTVWWFRFKKTFRFFDQTGRETLRDRRFLLAKPSLFHCCFPSLQKVWKEASLKKKKT